jgi:Na+/melibiose symporter-like transporter
MFFSALPMLLFFVLLWTPPVSGQSMWNLIYLALIYALYNVAYTFNQIPFTALLPELALTDHHRVRMSAWSAGCLLIGMILSGLAGPVIEGLGYLDTALIYAGIALPLLYLPLLVLHERPERKMSGPGVAVRRMDFWHSLVAVWRNRAFRLITATGILYRIVLVLVQAAIPFVVTEVCRLTRADTMYFYIPALLASLVCYPFLAWLSDRVGKWAVFAASLLASAVVLPGLMFIGDWFPVALRVQGVVWVALQATAMSGVTMLPPAFGAEVTDHGAARTGQHHEGTYYAAWGVIEQMINGAAMALLPLLLLLGRSRTDPHGPLGVRMIGIVGGALMFAAYLVFLRYPLRDR